MPRSSGRSSSSRSAPPRRQMSTAPAAHHPQPPVPHHAPPPPAMHQSQPQQPGLFAQMASTAAGVAVGSTVGHALGGAIGGMFGGGSSSNVEQSNAANVVPAQQQQAYASENTQAGVCDIDARNFTKCLDENNGNFQICDWYLQQLKACQEMSRKY
ncbi:hypothetical protein V1512DRAFT_274614 [Lipomyces arxii]|uniref:uncharacterized protein n=1 Tax=Lipomyces arxii TaxID=56418 RepID=UPI0034CF8B56